MTGERILVVKLGALGDVVLALGPFAAIRRHHPDARITLLTTAPYADFLRASPYFDEIWVDDRPPLIRVDRWLSLRHRLRAGHFDRVYDLQTSDRSGWYYRLMGPVGRPEWSGIARGCSHPHANPDRDSMHTIERQAEQLAAAGIAEVPPADLSWARADVGRFTMPQRYVLLVPGGAGHRPAKRWSARNYGVLGQRLVAEGFVPVILGVRDEWPLADGVRQLCPTARDMTGRTGLADIAVLARGAAGAIGNDTGPMHMIAAAGCPAVVLFSADSDPALAAPRGDAVVVLRRDRLEDLAVDEVAAVVRCR